MTVNAAFEPRRAAGRSDPRRPTRPALPFAGEYLTTFHRLLKITKLLEQLPHADRSSVFTYGDSHGAMMTYQAMRERYPMRAAAVYGGFTDIALLTAPGARAARRAGGRVVPAAHELMFAG